MLDAPTPMTVPAPPAAPVSPGLPLGVEAAWWVLPLLFAATFLLGSIPWGVIISRVAFHKDIRAEGSGNIGTTNAMRTLGKAGGAAVFVLDFGKGLLSGYLGWVAAGAFAPAATGAAWLALPVAFAGCVLGHVFSPWLGFKGGKGIAVAVGALFFVLGPVPALVEIAVFAVLVATTRYVSVGSLAAAILCPFLAFCLYWGHWASAVIVSAMACVVIWAHRGNIARLRAGTENRIGAKKRAAVADDEPSASMNGKEARS